jgi:subtilisin family serine protease
VKDDHSAAQYDDKNRWTAVQEISKAQFAAITAAAAEDGVSFEAELSGGAPAHIWQKDHILVSADVDEKTDPDLKRLGAVLAPNVDGSEQQVSPDLVKLLKLTKNSDRTTTRKIVEYLNVRDGLKGKVFINNLMYVTHGVGANLCPADEPTPIRPYPETIPYPPPSRGKAGRGVRVTVIDTGLSPGWEDNHPWLYDRDRHPPTEVTGDLELDTFGLNQGINEHTGHGTFIAGIIRCVAPRAKVRSSNTMRWAGTMHEFGVARTIIEALNEKPAPDIISLSAGCTIPEWAPDTGPRAMLDVMHRMSQPGCRTLLVAAAGNDGKGPDSKELFYPAAFAGDVQFNDLVVAVGALRPDRDGRACFSNWGDWVTVYEDGEKLVNAFPTGTYTYKEPLSGRRPPQCVYHVPLLEEGCTCKTAPVEGTVVCFHGMAVWSGTSFATPIIVGRVARRMTRRPKIASRPRAAWKDLLKKLIEIKDAGDQVRLNVFPKRVGP